MNQVMGEKNRPLQTPEDLVEAGPDVFVEIAINVMKHVKASGHRGATMVSVVQIWALVMTLDMILQGIAVMHAGELAESENQPEEINP